MQTLFVSHGGGPLPLLGDPGHFDLVASWKNLVQILPRKPSAIAVVSAHWESKGFSVVTGKNPELIYDYYGFPEESYRLQYRASGAPDLATKLVTKLNATGIHASANRKRGYDHGVFIPLSVLYPDADVPVFQISLDKNLDPSLHWRLGESLRQFLPKDALLLGSGFSFHNLPLFFNPSPNTEKASKAFHEWLDKIVCDKTLHSGNRKQGWLQWDEAPAARKNHPREEHLLPLLVCCAAAQRPAEKISVNVLNINARHYLWL